MMDMNMKCFDKVSALGLLCCKNTAHAAVDVKLLESIRLCACERPCGHSLLINLVSRRNKVSALHSSTCPVGQPSQG